MPNPAFRLVCVASALSDAPAGWARDMLRDGEIALLPEQDGLTGVNGVAHALGLPSIAVVRGEDDAAQQEQTVMEYAGSLPLVWIAPAFSEPAHEWARRRGAMTLLVDAGAPLRDEERRRVDRFVATLGRQSE